jgi:hypothetical protein
MRAVGWCSLKPRKIRASWYQVGDRAFTLLSVVYAPNILTNNIIAASASGSAAEALYRDANSLNYADNKPSEEAIDRVVSKLNQEYAIFQMSFYFVV